MKRDIGVHLGMRAVAVAAAVGLIALPLPTLAADPGSIEGTVTAGSAPVVGARVVAAGAEGTAFTSTPTGGDGAFRIADVAAGTYRLEVETEKGLFPVESPVKIAPGKVQMLTVVLHDANGDGGSGRGAGSFWKSTGGRWAGVALVAGSVLFLSEAIPEDKDVSLSVPESPSQPD